MRFVTDESEINIKDGFSIVYFYTPDLLVHKKMTSWLNQIKGVYKNIRFYAVDANLNKITKRYQINCVPTILVFKDGGEIIKSISGFLSKEAMKSSIDDIYNLYNDTLGDKKMKKSAKKVAKKEVKEVTKKPELDIKPVQAAKPELTKAEKIWQEIKDVQINMFSLPDQTVGKYCTPIKADPDKLYLHYKGVGAVLPALEDAFSRKYNVELVEKYIVMSHKPVPLK